MPVVILTFYLNYLDRLNNITPEFRVVWFLPVGWLIGSAALKSIAILKSIAVRL